MTFRAPCAALVATSALVLASLAGATSPGANGRIAFASTTGGTWKLATIAAGGTARATLAAAPGINAQPAWSPDGSRVAFVCANFQLCLAKADGTELVRLTDTGAWNGTWVYDVDPAWSPDGAKLAFGSTREGGFRIFLVNADGTGLRALAGSGAGRADRDPAWSPDGTRIAFTSTAGSFESEEGDLDVWVMNADGSGAAPVTAAKAVERRPTWSPGGGRIGYERFPLGDDETQDIGFQIWTMNPDGGVKKVLTPGRVFDLDPAWSPDGTRLVYTSARVEGWDLFTTGAHGVRLTSTPAAELMPDWQSVPAAPTPAPTPATLPAPPGATGDARLVAALLAVELDIVGAIGSFGEVLAGDGPDLEALFAALHRYQLVASRSSRLLRAQRPSSERGARLKRLTVGGYAKVAAGMVDLEAASVAGFNGQNAKADRLFERAEAELDAGFALLAQAGPLVTLSFV